MAKPNCALYTGNECNPIGSNAICKEEKKCYTSYKKKIDLADPKDKYTSGCYDSNKNETYLEVVRNIHNPENPRATKIIANKYNSSSVIPDGQDFHLYLNDVETLRSGYTVKNNDILGYIRVINRENKYISLVPESSRASELIKRLKSGDKLDFYFHTEADIDYYLSGIHKNTKKFYEKYFKYYNRCTQDLEKATNVLEKDFFFSKSETEILNTISQLEGWQIKKDGFGRLCLANCGKKDDTCGPYHGSSPDGKPYYLLFDKRPFESFNAELYFISGIFRRMATKI